MYLAKKTLLNDPSILCDVHFWLKFSDVVTSCGLTYFVSGHNVQSKYVI